MSEPQTDGDHYVGHDVAGQHIGLVPDPGTTSPRGARPVIAEDLRVSVRQRARVRDEVVGRA